MPLMKEKKITSFRYLTTSEPALLITASFLLSIIPILALGLIVDKRHIDPVDFGPVSFVLSLLYLSWPRITASKRGGVKEMKKFISENGVFKNTVKRATVDKY